MLTELAALRQQVSDQQHGIDQNRQDSSAAINTGLTEVRAVIREGLTRTNDNISDPLTQIGGELVAIRSGISDLTRNAQLAEQLEEPVADDLPGLDGWPATEGAEPDVSDDGGQGRKRTSYSLKTSRSASGFFGPRPVSPQPPSTLTATPGRSSSNTPAETGTSASRVR
ncbi:hypothetical protein [Streptomyces sp. NPDC057257]|uniref:hypothetical protein n=1 Tax=Streptomyces sp. NPDC057257 TaxID=3346071 RepID=UPI003626D867